jgi:transposase
MPYKHNESRRHKIEKAKYRIINWPEYNNALRKRGDFTVYFTEEAIDGWHSPKLGKRGRPQKYSVFAIKASLMIRQVFRLPLRQTQGFMNSLVTALDIDISLPDFSSLSKRSVALPRHKLTNELEAGSIVIVDSTGLKVYGKDEWHQEKHDVAARRTWRKLDLAVDENHQIIACELTTPETGDPTAVPDLLDQIDTPFDTFIADGAYDGDPVSQAILKQLPAAQVVVPPHKTAVCSTAGDSQRDNHIRVIDEIGRIAWQQKTSYNLRNYAEMAMQRVKRIFGNTMKARKLPQQKTEAWVTAVALNSMTSLGMPVSVKI